MRRNEPQVGAKWRGASSAFLLSAFASSRGLGYEQRVGRAFAALMGVVLPWRAALAQSQEVEVVVAPQTQQDRERVGREVWDLSTHRLDVGGAVELGAVFAGQAQLAVTPGNAGLGGAANKLNLAARGVNPRFGSRTQWLFDGLPLAIAPYGRPQLTMFPLTMGWLDRVEVDLGGVKSYMGPHAIGGHVRLSLADIEPGHQEKLQFRVDQFGQVQASLLVQMATAREQWVMGYTTTQGSGYREHSRIQSHGALVRWRRRIGQRHRLGVSAIAHGEDTQIPGGLTPIQFEHNPRASMRPLDRFKGARLSGGVFWDAVLLPGFVFSTKVVGGVTDRQSEISTQMAPQALTAPLRVTPRRFHFLSFASRLRADLGELGELPVKARVEFGVAPTLEWAELKSENRDPLSGARLSLRSQDKESIFAMAIDGSFTLTDADRRWHWQAGMRAQWVGLSRQSLTSFDLGRRHLFAVLPSTQLQFRLHARLKLVAEYGQSYSPPQFLQISLAKDKAQLAPERGHSAHLGLDGQFVEDRLRVKVVGFYKSIQNYADVSAQRLEQPGRMRALGVESQASFAWPLTKSLGPRLGARLGHTWTHGRILGGAFHQLRLPWVSPHRLRASVSVQDPSKAGLFVRGGLAYDAAQRSHYGREEPESEDGGRGTIPAWTTLWASLGLGRLALGSSWQAQLSLRADNLLDQVQYTRTPDRNAGRLLMVPRRVSLLLRLVRKQKTQAASDAGLGFLR